ncbi:hypothetical protein TNCV_3410231 [Trichonephila clavipes]|nr:hypothetical protein TNCV_3410231 [Trichonephila clavipes]
MGRSGLLKNSGGRSPYTEERKSQLAAICLAVAVRMQRRGRRDGLDKTTELQRKLNFHNIPYYSGENINNFAHRLETAAEYMLAEAQTNEAKTITHSIILSTFITSLPQNFQRKLSSKNPFSLKEAIDIAVKMQQNSETHTTCSMLLQPVKTVNGEQDSITQKLDELTNQIAILKTEQKPET